MFSIIKVTYRATEIYKPYRQQMLVKNMNLKNYTI